METFSEVMAGWKGQLPVWVNELRKMGVSDVAFFSQLDGRKVLIPVDNISVACTT
jgi:hypothetical protein